MTNVNIVQLNHTATKMTSLQIAELVGSRHDKVKQSIERLVDRSVIVQPPMGDEQSQDTKGRMRTTQVYIFTGEQGKRDSIIVVAQLCPEFTAKLVDRWQELENRTALDLNNPEHLRNLLIGYTEKVTHLQEQVKTLAPKADGLDRLASAKNLISIRDASKSLKIGQKVLVECLIEKKVVFRGEGHDRLQAYQKSIDQKLVGVVMSKPKETKDGYKSFPQVKLTQKLITRIASWLEKQKQEVVAA